MEQEQAVLRLIRAVRAGAYPHLLAYYVEVAESAVAFLATLYDVAPAAVGRLLRDLGEFGTRLPELVAAARARAPHASTVTIFGTLGIETWYTQGWNAAFIDEGDHAEAITPEIQARLPWHLTRPWLSQDRWYLDLDACVVSTLIRLLRASFEVDLSLSNTFWETVFAHLPPEQLRAMLKLARRALLTNEVLEAELPLEEVLRLVPRATIWEYLVRVFNLIEADEVHDAELDE